MSTPEQQAAAEAQEREERDAEARADGQSFARTVGEGVGATVDTARTGADAIGDAVGGAAGTVREQGVVGAATGAGAATGRHVSRSVNRVNWGGLVGGLLGVGGAWFVSTMFGGGMFGTIAFMLLAIPGFLMGRGFGARNMNSLFGGENDSPARDGRGQQLQRETSTTVPSQAAGLEQASEQTPQQKLQHEVVEVEEKTRLAREAVAQMVQNGEINPRRAEIMGRNIANVERMVEQMHRLDTTQMSEPALNRVTREFGEAEQYLDQLIARQPTTVTQGYQTVSGASMARTVDAQRGLDAATLDSIQQTQAIYARSGARLQPGDFGLADATSAVPVVPGQQAAAVRGA